MKFKSACCDVYLFLHQNIFMILWISLVFFLFYDTFVCYKYGQEFYYLRRILGLGLCISRGTATVINLCSALILLPICKKLNQILYAILSHSWPGLFFFWLEKAKSIHMTVAITLTVFAVLHSISHFVNLWNFSRGYDEERLEINFANYRNENPLVLLLSMAGLTGLSMLVIILSMSLTSMRVIRRKVYNAFWYTHQLYVPFVVLLIIHPLSGVLKKQVIENESSLYPSQIENWSNSTKVELIFVPIQSRAWLWMLLPLTCYCMELLWRILTRNRATVEILEAILMPGRTISLNLSCPHDRFMCRAGQYVLLQCLDVSLIEWHPFTVVKVPTSCQRNFTVWIRVKGDWTEALENLLVQQGPSKLSILVDGPFSSPMEGVSGNEVAICIAAGVGITPFVSLLHNMLLNPRGRSPGRIHLIWIVKQEQELLWLASLANRTITELRDANRPDRLHLEFYVTGNKDKIQREFNHSIVIDEKGEISHLLKVDNRSEKVPVLIPNSKRNCVNIKNSVNISEDLENIKINVINNPKPIKINNCNEMVPLLASKFKLNNSTIKSKDLNNRVDVLTPNLNRNSSRIQYADDANETDTLLTPTLKRSNSKKNQIDSKVANSNYRVKSRHDIYPDYHKIHYDNIHDMNEEAVLNMNLDSNNQNPRSINNRMSNNGTTALKSLKYEGNIAWNKNNYVINNSFQVNPSKENHTTDRISKEYVPCKVYKKDDHNEIKNNLQRSIDAKEFDISKDFPLLACRVRRGRPHWDRVFGYWVHLYPRNHLNLYCCGPKKLVKLLKEKCKEYSRSTKTSFAFIHEGFS